MTWPRLENGSEESEIASHNPRLHSLQSCWTRCSFGFIILHLYLYIYIGYIGERDFDCCITIGCSIASIDSSRLFKLTNLKVHNQLYMCLILILSSNSFLNTIFCLQIECCEGIAVNYAVTKCSVSLHENPSGHLDGRIDCCQERQGGNCHSGDVWLITI